MKAAPILMFSDSWHSEGAPSPVFVFSDEHSKSNGFFSPLEGSAIHSQNTVVV